MNEQTQQTTALTTIDTAQPMSLPTLRHQVNQIQQVMESVMKPGEHYGKIPGCGEKPSLLQPGAQKLALTFGFAAAYDVTQTDKPGNHREYNVRCKLTHRASGSFVGEGVGCASSMEGKYRFRTGPKNLTDKAVPQQYWDLRKDDPKAAQQLLGGPGFSTQKNESGTWMIAQGGGEKIEHDNPADYYNTILKMAKKRAFVDATLTACAASDIFTQDIEDDPDLFGNEGKKTQPQQQQQQQQQQTSGATSQTTTAGQNSNAAATSGNFHVTGVRTKREGTGAKGPWRLATIVTDVEGFAFDTFDEDLSALAEQCMKDGIPVYCEWQHNAKYKTLELKTLCGVDDSQQQNPSTSAGGGDGLVEAVIHAVEEPKKVRLEGRESQAWPIETSQGRMGTFDSQIADIARGYQGTGVLVNIGVIVVKNQRVIESISESVANAEYDERF